MRRTLIDYARRLRAGKREAASSAPAPTVEAAAPAPADGFLCEALRVGIHLDNDGSADVQAAGDAMTREFHHPAGCVELPLFPQSLETTSCLTRDE